MHIYRQYIKAKKLRRALFGKDKHSLAHVRCIYDNLGDIGVAEAINTLFRNFWIIDYSYDSKINMLEKLANTGLLNYACLGGGTLIFSSMKAKWFLTLKELIQRNSNLLFTCGTGVRDPLFFRSVNQDVIREWVECLKRFRLVSVRGELSKQMLQENGIEDVKVVGDPALLYSRPYIIPKKRARRIGINISKNHPFYGNSKEETVRLFKKLILFLINEGWAITLFPTCREDVFLSEQLCKGLGTDAIKIHKKYWVVKSFLDEIEEQDIFIGVKLHSIIFSYCTYTPALMVAYQPKCYDFMDTMDMGDLVLRSDHLEFDTLVEKLAYLNDTTEEIQKRQYAMCQTFRQRLLEFRDQVYSIMGNM
ncbi:MAG: polysaccharide pyruvyl transferase family protein [Candidatus Omnitrophota bacterium]|nr:MAG: polysaccharide pyruvyl transferase family protein [Candidatus Omnitrophota bacterium]